MNSFDLYLGQLIGGHFENGVANFVEALQPRLARPVCYCHRNNVPVKPQCRRFISPRKGPETEGRDLPILGTLKRLVASLASPLIVADFDNFLTAILGSTRGVHEAIPFQMHDGRSSGEIFRFVCHADFGTLDLVETSDLGAVETLCHASSAWRICVGGEGRTGSGVLVPSAQLVGLLDLWIEIHGRRAERRE